MVLVLPVVGAGLWLVVQKDAGAAVGPVGGHLQSGAVDEEISAKFTYSLFSEDVFDVGASQIEFMIASKQKRQKVSLSGN